VAALRRDTPPRAPQRGHDRTVVVCAAFDPATDAAIERLRDRIAAAGHRVRRAHRPHLTLSAARVDDIEPVVRLAESIAAAHPPISITMAGVRSFASGVLFVAPENSTALRELQCDAYETMSAHWPPAFGPQSEPQEWVPHCTLATRLAGPVRSALQQLAFEPFPATVEALAVILVGGRGDVAHLPLAAQA
jgi:2'-5' RNA ligase